jgi:5-methylcytosine-specific restriction endonuclease McrA
MKYPKPCRLCPSKRFGSSSWCRSHFYERERAKKAEKADRAWTRRMKTKSFQIKIYKKLKAKLDTAFSLLIRKKGKCERCGKRENLQCSHVYGRANLAVRWDLENATCLCAGCHNYWWHLHPAEALDWLRTVRTPEQLEALRIRSLAKATWTPISMAIRLDEINKALAS